jgi:hypothetical protein
VSDVTRVCGWCQTDISHKRSNAKYCCRQHKVNANSVGFRAKNPDYYKRHRARNREYYENYRAVNRQVMCEYSRSYRELHPAETAAAAAAWWAANPDKHREYQDRRRAATLDNPGSVGVSERDWIRLVRRYRYCCAYCGKRPVKLHRDHVIPLVRGGRHAIGNILPACRSCNSRKCARFITEWRRGKVIDRRLHRYRGRVAQVAGSSPVTLPG